MKKLDYFLIVIYSIVAMCSFIFIMDKPIADNVHVEIYIDNDLWGVYELPKSGYKDILVKEKGENIVRIAYDGVAVIHSDCKGQLCVHQGFIKNSNSVIACLPNGLLVQLVGKEDYQIDMMSY